MVGTFFVNLALRLAPAKYRQGTKTKVTVVANSTPKASEETIGIKNLACMLVSSKMGTNPIKVVIEVKIMGLKRS